MPLTVPELTTFLDRVDEQAIAVSLTSKAGMKPDDYVEALERQWASPVPQERAGAGAARPSRRPGPGRTTARRATASRVGSSARHRSSIRELARSGMTAGAVVLLALVMVLFALGLD